MANYRHIGMQRSARSRAKYLYVGKTVDWMRHNFCVYEDHLSCNSIKEALANEMICYGISGSIYWVEK